MTAGDDGLRGRVGRFGASGVLRLASAGVQFWGGTGGHETALIVEAGEEFTDGLTYGAVAIEAAASRRGLAGRARQVALWFAGAAAVWATTATVLEIMHDSGQWLAPLDGFNLADREIMAATIAVALSCIVFILNFRGRRSGRVSDKFAYRDSLRDFVIPGAILILAALRAPHLAEYVFETGGLIYGWYNVAQLFKGWRGRLKRPATAGA